MNSIFLPLVNHPCTSSGFSTAYPESSLIGCVNNDNCKNHGTRLKASNACFSSGSDCGGIINAGRDHWEIREGIVPMWLHPNNATGLVEGYYPADEAIFHASYVKCGGK